MLPLVKEFMLTVPVEDWIVFQQIYLIKLITCKFVTTNDYVVFVIVLSSLMKYHRISNKNNTTGATSETGTPSCVSVFTPNLKFVNCSSRGLDSIPTDLPNKTNYL
jgi:hypothetical protein